jgi:phosphotransferase system IIB component
MLFEIKGICQNCAEEVTVLVHNGQPISQCHACAEDPFEIEKMAGVVYVVKNKNQVGVKIGSTSKTVEERMKQLSSTGVPGKFEAVAIFPSTNPIKHEKRVHEKLIKKRLDKEHFNFEPVEAVLKIYRTLNKRIKPIFYDDEQKEIFLLELEKSKIEMALKLKGKKH